jgi:ABC-type bacteriocin/lantibiotic exporter with double-glycine peptidase domain
MLLISSFIIGLCALAPSLFVIIVLNKYLASGVTATLLSLAAGAIMLLIFEFAFRQNRGSMLSAFNQRVYDPLLKAFTEKFKTAGQLTAQEYKKLDGAGTMIKNMRTSSVTSWILDWPFVLMFLVVLLYINWTAAIITAIFMIVMMLLTAQRVNLSLQQNSTANLEIFLTGLMTIVIMSVGATQIIAGTLDVGLLIGSNILAARALQGSNKYAKAKEAIKQRDKATAEIISFIKQ